jgi:hypothetical protein
LNFKSNLSDVPSFLKVITAAFKLTETIIMSFVVNPKEVG